MNDPVKRIHFDLEPYPTGPNWDKWFAQFPMHGIRKLLGNVGFFYVRYMLENDPDSFAKMIRFSSTAIRPPGMDDLNTKLSKVIELLEERNET